MKYLDLTHPTPEENLTCDRNLLEQAEESGKGEVLRFWESKTYFVVLGYSGKADTDVNLKACEKDDIPILRRVSGGGTVLQGPGCLNYGLILRIPPSGPLTSLIKTNEFVLKAHQKALESVLKKRVDLEGVSDLAIEGLKFSGNAQRRRRRFLLYHGTLLYGFNLDLIEKYLLMPARQPSYRRNRSHSSFLTNLSLPAESLKSALRQCWRRFSI